MLPLIVLPLELSPKTRNFRICLRVLSGCFWTSSRFVSGIQSRTEVGSKFCLFWAGSSDIFYFCPSSKGRGWGGFRGEGEFL